MTSNFKEILNKTLMGIGLALMIGVMILGDDFRNKIAEFSGIVLNPLNDMMGIGNFHITLFALAVITALCASLVQKYSIDWEFTKRVQSNMKEFQKKYREAQVSGNAKEIKKMEIKQKEMMGDQMKMMKQQFKPMLYISIISLPLFLWAHHHTTLHQIYITFPFMGEQLLSGSIFGPFEYWIFWSILSSISISNIIRKVLGIGGI